MEFDTEELHLIEAALRKAADTYRQEASELRELGQHDLVKALRAYTKRLEKLADDIETGM